MSLREGRFAGVPARLYRLSFSGELGYEINVPARYGAALWVELLKAGADFGVTPYGVETVLLLRLEKGYLHVGVDTDCTTLPADVGWGDVAANEKRISSASVARAARQQARRPSPARRPHRRRCRGAGPWRAPAISGYDRRHRRLGHFGCRTRRRSARRSRSRSCAAAACGMARS